jgi:tetratricopeptide (TPR) repeat protein
MGVIERLLALLGLRISPESLTKKAAQFAAREDVMAAVEQYKKALTADPLYVPAYDGLGKVYYRMGFRDEADREFAIADGLEKLKTDPSDVEAGVKMGRAMLDKGLNKQAAALLEPVWKASNKNRTHPDLLKIMGVANKAIGSDKRARELFRLGLEKWSRDPDFYLHLSSLEIAEGNKEEGERLGNIARLMAKMRSDPGDATSRYNLGVLFYKRKLYNDAAEYLRQAVKIDDQNAGYWTFLGECYIQAGMHQVAVDAFKKAIKVAPADPQPHKLLSKVYHLMGKFDESRASKELAVVLDGGQNGASNPTQGARFVKYLLNIGQVNEAGEQLERMLEQWPDSLDLKVIHGRLLFRDKKYQEAVDVLKDVAEAKEKWAEPHLWMAMAYQRLGDSMSALAEGQLATRLAPKSHAAHKVLGDILREQKKFGMAENAYETAENLKPKKKGKKA